MPILKATYQQQKQHTKSFLRIRFTLGMLLLVTCLILPAQTPKSREYQIKATFLFNFTQFVEWPSSAFSDEQTPMVIGILGEDPFGSFLDQTVSGEKMGTHPIIVQRYSSVEEIKTCHILFINIPLSNQLNQALASLKGRNILTVGDVANFAQQGGVIRLLTENNKIGFRINLTAAKEANLTISSKLLRLAEVITPKPN